MMSKTSFLLRNILKTKLPNSFGTQSVKCLTTKHPSEPAVKSSTNTPFLGSQYDDDDETQEVLDVYKERLKYNSLLEDQEQEESVYAGLNLKRGVSGVFDIEDLVETLQKQQAEDIFVASVPKEIKYVDYMVIVSGRSRRHMQAISQFVRRMYKLKRLSTDIVPKLEGEHSSDWMAIDLGNIAIHIFSPKARLVYDMDSLWAVGSRYDEECNKKEPVSSLLELQTFSLRGLEPAE